MMMVMTVDLPHMESASSRAPQTGGVIIVLRVGEKKLIK